MRFADFERRAHDDWKRIPQTFRSGVDGVVVKAEALAHPEMPDVFTMGECITESFPSQFGSAETTRSAVVLYYGSFQEISRQADDFDWEHEIWETLTHELQHHLESLAGDDTLGDMDYASDQNFRRLDGETFDAFFYREGEPLDDGAYRVDDEFFIERPLTAATTVVVEWHGREIRVAVPDVGDADVAYIEVVDENEMLEDVLTIVLIREVKGLRAIGTLIRPRAPVVVQAEGIVT